MISETFNGRQERDFPLIKILREKKEIKKEINK
jgi:hypothetical protein